MSQGTATAFLAIILWSVSATLSARLLGTMTAPQLVLIIHFAALVILSLALLPCAGDALRVLRALYGRLRSRAHARILDGRLLITVVLTGIALLLYDVLFYFALSLGNPVDVVIINSLWPLFALLWADLVKPATWRRPSGRQVTWMLVAFVGATVVIWDRGRSSPGAVPSVAYVLALFSAVVGGLWDILLVRIWQALESAAWGARGGRRGDSAGGDAAVGQKVACALLAQLLSRLVILPVLLAALAFVSFENVVVFEYAEVLLIVLFGYVVADVAMTYAYQEYASPLVGSMVYLTPISTGVLMVFFLHVTVSTWTLAGLVLVVAANVLLHSPLRTASAANSFLAVALVVAVACLFVPASGSAQAELSPKVETLAGIFAIVIGYSLTRASANTTTEQAAFARFGQALQRVLDAIGAAGGGAQQAHAAAIALMERALDYRHADSVAEREELVDRIFASERELRALARPAPAALEKAQGGGAHRSHEAVSALRAALEDWLAERSARLVQGELVITGVLAAIISVALVLTRSDGVQSDISTIFFAAGICFLWFLLRDYSFGRVALDAEKLALTQRFVFRHEGMYYLPNAYVRLHRMPRPEATEAITFYLHAADGRREVRVARRENLVLRHLPSFLMMLSIGCIVAMLWARHAGVDPARWLGVS